MSDADTPPYAALPHPVSASNRLDNLEKALALDSRLETLEATISARRPDSTPWWRSSKTITIIGALIATVLPLLKFIEESSKNRRENQRQILEQQEKIRQTYLDRVLKPGTTVYEQQKIFNLLVELSADPAMQKWAQAQLKETTDSITAWTKERDEAIEKKSQLCREAATLDYAGVKLDSPVKQRIIANLEAVKVLDSKIATIDRYLSTLVDRDRGCFK